MLGAPMAAQSIELLVQDRMSKPPCGREPTDALEGIETDAYWLYPSRLARQLDHRVAAFG